MVKKAFSCILGTALLLTFSTVSFAAAQYTVTDLGKLPYSGFITPYGLNNLGHVVGAINIGGDVRGFLWRNGQFQILTPLSGHNTSKALGINDHDEIVGWSGNDTQSTSKACLWRNGGVQDIGTLGGSTSTAISINNLGQIVGYSKTVGYFGYDHPFIWENGRMTDLLPPNTGRSAYIQATCITDGGKVCGNSLFVWENGVLTSFDCTIPDAYSNMSYALSMNDSGQVVGGYRKQSDLSERGFIWQNGVTIDMGILAGDFICKPRCINGDGVAVGLSSDYTATRAFKWQNGTMTDLNTLILSNSGWNLTDATAINAKGQIVGTGLYNGATRAFLLTPVPEPTGMYALLVSLSGMGIMLRRKARH